VVYSLANLIFQQSCVLRVIEFCKAKQVDKFGDQQAVQLLLKNIKFSKQADCQSYLKSLS